MGRLKSAVNICYANRNSQLQPRRKKMKISASRNLADNKCTTMSELDNQSSDASSQDDHYEDVRPNRWKGPLSTWHSLTEQERGLAASLDTLRNEDLSVHLFNAHALKRRAREIEEKEVFHRTPE